MGCMMEKVLAVAPSCSTKIAAGIAIVLSLAGAVPGWCAHKGVASSQLDVFVPDHAPVIAPGPEIPPSIARLAGAWEGVWSDGTTSVLVIRRIDTKTADLLLASNRYGSDESLPWHLWARAQVKNGSPVTLEWKQKWATLDVTLSSDGRRLEAVFREIDDHENEKSKTVSMSRRTGEQLTVDSIGPPFACSGAGNEFRRIEMEQDPKTRSDLVDELVKRVPKAGAPLIEPGSRKGFNCATFLFRGAARDVALAGFMNGFSAEKDFLARVPETDLFFFSQEYPSDARIEYKFAVDGTMTLDPLNPRTLAFGRGVNSVAAMPAYIPPPEIEPDPHAAKGVVEEVTIASKQPGMTRNVTVYLPAGYESSMQQYPVLYLNDAFGVLKFGRIVTILDNLIAWKKVPPLIVVLVPFVKDRTAEHSMNPTVEAFFADELVPAIDARFRTLQSPDQRGVGGISAGATAALSLAIRRPDIFGNCIAQSTAISLVPLIQLARTGPARPIAVYFDVGCFETDFYGRDLVDSTRRLRDALRAHGCRVFYQEVSDGHGWANWRARTRDALTFLFSSGFYGKQRIDSH